MPQYVVTDKIPPKSTLGGQRVKPGDVITLTAAEAEFELLRGTIYLQGNTPPPVTVAPKNTVPPGGDVGQVLIKQSTIAGDTKWEDIEDANFSRRGTTIAGAGTGAKAITPVFITQAAYDALTTPDPYVAYHIPEEG